jgi:hypothetical protein
MRTETDKLDHIHRKRANRYRTRITDHENKLIDALSNPHPNARKLKKTWPEDLTN